jgi:hypothetical protein
MKQVERIIDEADIYNKSRAGKIFCLTKMLTSTQVNEIKPINATAKNTDAV